MGFYFNVKLDSCIFSNYCFTLCVWVFALLWLVCLFVLPVYVSVCHTCDWCSQKLEEAIGSPETGVTGSCEGKWNQVLWKSKQPVLLTIISAPFVEGGVVVSGLFVVSRVLLLLLFNNFCLWGQEDIYTRAVATKARRQYQIPLSWSESPDVGAENET